MQNFSSLAGLEVPEKFVCGWQVVNIPDGGGGEHQVTGAIGGGQSGTLPAQVLIPIHDQLRNGNRGQNRHGADGLERTFLALKEVKFYLMKIDPSIMNLVRTASTFLAQNQWSVGGRSTG